MTARRDFLIRSSALVAGAMFAPGSLLAATGEQSSAGAARFSDMLNDKFLLFTDGFRRFDVVSLQEVRYPDHPQPGLEQFTLVFQRESGLLYGAALDEGTYHAYAMSGQKFDFFIQPTANEDAALVTYRAEFSLLGSTEPQS